MIQVELRVTITAKDDAEADQVLRLVNGLSRRWPETPIVSITERSRERIQEGS